MEGNGGSVVQVITFSNKLQCIVDVRVLSFCGRSYFPRFGAVRVDVDVQQFHCCVTLTLRTEGGNRR